MAFYIRQETLRFTGTISGGIMQFAVNGQAVDYNTSMIDDCRVVGGGGGYGFTVECIALGTSPDGLPYLRLTTGRPGYQTQTTSLLMQTQFASINHLTDLYRNAISGSWTCDIEAYLVWEPSTVSDSMTGHQIFMPTFGGSAGVVDPPTYRVGRIYYVTKSGGTATCTLSISGFSPCVFTETLSGYTEIPFACSSSVNPKNHYQYYNNSGGYYGPYPGETQTLSAPIVVNGAAVGAPGYSYSASGGSVDGTPSATVVAASSAGTGHSAGASLIGYPRRSYVLNINLSALNKPYPSTLGLCIDEDATRLGIHHDFGGGSSSFSHTQHRYTIQGTVDGVDDPHGLNVNEFAPVRCWLRSGSVGDTPTSGDTTSLTAWGEDPTDWRVLQHGFSWGAMALSQAASVAADAAPSAANWTAGAHTSLGSGLSIVVATPPSGSSWTGSVSSTLTAAAPASLKGSIFSGVSFVGYRFLRLYLTADAASQPARLVIGGKQWDFTVGTSGYVDIDLCRPTNAGVTTDGTDTTWPYNAPTGIILVDGALWGVSNVTSLVIGNLASGHTYTLSGVSLLRHDHSYFNCLPSRPGWINKVPPITSGSTTTTTEVRRGFQGDTDGRQSLELEDVVHINVTGTAGSVDTYNDVPISGIVGAMATGSNMPLNGWSATDSQPNPHTPFPGGSPARLYNDYLNSDLASVFLMGGGILFGQDGVVSYGLDINANSSTSVTGQELFDYLTDWVPCNDVFGFAAHPAGDGTIYLCAGKMLRGDSWGLVLGQTSGKSGVTVNLSKTGSLPAEDDGSAVSDGIGEYRQLVSGAATGSVGTGLPFGKGLVSYDVKAVSGSNPTLTRSQLARRRLRACFVTLGSAGKQPSIDISVAGRKARAYVQDDTIRVGTANTPLPQMSDWNDVDTTFLEQWPCIRWELRTAQPRLLLLSLASDNSLHLRYSMDEGASWNMASLSASGTFGVEVETDHGLKYIYYRTSDGKIKGQILDAQFNVIVSEFTCKNQSDGSDISGVDDTGIDADHFTLGGGVWYIELMYFSSGTPIVVTARDGMNFS